MNNLGTHIIKNPVGSYSFVGSLPTALGNEVLATKSDVMGGRAHYNVDGVLMTWHYPSHYTEKAARDFAMARGVSINEVSK
jgi:hypothetical protein